jgi:NADH-quinone oxidoreductase subunit L
VIVNPLRSFANWLAVVFDVRLIDGAVNGLGRLVGWCSQQARSLQSGQVRSYAVAILGGAVILLIYVLLR